MFFEFDEISRRHQYFLFQCNIIPLKLDSKGASDEKVLPTRKKSVSDQIKSSLGLI